MIDRRIVKYKLRRGTDVQRQQVVFDEGELAYITDKQRVYVGDGDTMGGVLLNNKIFTTTSTPTSAEYTEGDLLYRSDVRKFFVVNDSTWNYVGPYPDEETINFNSSNNFSVVTGSISRDHLNSNVANLTGGIAYEPVSGLYVNYDPYKLRINSNGQLSLAGSFSVTLDPTGGVVDPLGGDGIKLNIDNTTLTAASNIVKVGVISSANIADASVAYAKLSSDVLKPDSGLSATSSGFAVNYNTTTMTLSNGQLCVNPTYILSNLPTSVAVPAGTIIYTARLTPPDGYLVANGEAKSRTTYSQLCAAIGFTYGNGDGSTTFNLPDLQGYFIRCAGTNSDLTSAADIGARQQSSVERHSHSITTYGATQGGVNTGVDNKVWSRTASTFTGTYGGDETRPKNIALLACIKY